MHGVNMPSQPEMSIARDIHVDACSVRLVGLASIASPFGGLMYEMLISRPDIAVAVGAFTVSAISLLVTDAGIVHGGAMQVFHTYLHDVCGMSTSVWTYTGARQPDAHDHQPPVGTG